jgi:hypothetical protein
MFDDVADVEDNRVFFRDVITIEELPIAVAVVNDVPNWCPSLTFFVVRISFSGETGQSHSPDMGAIEPPRQEDE